MTTIYVTKRFVKNGKYTGVYQTTQGFVKKEHAEMYQQAHNAQYPHDQLQVDELNIVDGNGSFEHQPFSFETFEYAEIKFVFAEDRLEKTVQNILQGNSIDQTSEVLNKVDHFSKSRSTIPFLSSIKPEDIKQERIHEITLCQRINPNQPKEEIIEEMTTRAHRLAKRAVEFGDLGDFTPYSAKDYLNDETLTKKDVLQTLFQAARNAY